MLQQVSQENYDRGIRELKEYLAKDSEYPNFRSKIERYINHSIDLVNAIRAKKSFPGLTNLPMAKQEDINAKTLEHFCELIYALKKVEKIKGDLRVEDVRSTTVVVQAASWCILIIFLIGFSLELAGGTVWTMTTVIDDVFYQVIHFLLSLVGM